MLDALKFVQGAVAKKDFAPELTHFQIKDGFIRSYNGAISLCSPIELNLDCQPKGKAFIKAIQTCRETVQLSLTPTGKLSVKSGKFRALVECFPEPFALMAPAGRRIELGPGFLAALTALEPLIGEDASRPWSRGILLYKEYAYATNNIVLARFDMGEWSHDGALNIPHAAVNELLRIKAVPTEAWLEDNAISFIYEDGRWIRTTLSSTDWPDVDKVISSDRLVDMESAYYGEDGYQVPPDLFQALNDLAPFTDETRAFHIKKNFVTTSLDPEIATYYQVDGMPDIGKFNIDMWRMLDGIATRFWTSTRPGLVLFAGDRIDGALIGMRS